MESYQFYKSIYDRELSRRKDLDADINLPITILSVLFAANSYLIKEGKFDDKYWTAHVEFILLTAVYISITITIVFLIKSYNNFFKGFAYKNMGLMTEVRKYEEQVVEYNLKVVENKISFEDVVINKIVNFTDNHIIFNDVRHRDIYKAKTSLVITMIITAFNFILVTFKYLEL
ncbi:hypothetical protein [uncultured Mucilaginibacter sp.]|uniref:hypothetical protein n=1 Tax=uncultured Mucilaginibacter sp. TaxID=797541 RepID=UPI00261666D5|nr:hypothetical protein [uncultured Mucilaginibacter sp.]